MSARRPFGGTQRDLGDFLAVAADWVSPYLPDRFTPVTAALARVLAPPAPALPPQP